MIEKAGYICTQGCLCLCAGKHMGSLSKALEMEAGGIELDLHLSKDGHVVICHDEQVDRVSNGSGLIRDKTLDELKNLDFGSWFGKAFEGENTYI